MCLAELTYLLLDCVNIMAVQLKRNLSKRCLLFAEALALLSDLISQQSHSMDYSPRVDYSPP